jgi:protein involved in polysaccharide export with SLBB domain
MIFRAVWLECLLRAGSAPRICMMNRVSWNAAAALCATFLCIAAGSARAQTMGNCDPSDPTCGGGQTTIPATNAPSYGNNNGSANGGNVNGGAAQGAPGFNPSTGFAPSPYYTDKQNQYNENDWWEQYRFNPDRALALSRPTEFQKMVASSTGRLLPLFGSDLFWGSPSTFAPVEQVPVTPEYLVGPGDQLVIIVWGQVSTNALVTVGRDGSINLPQVGPIYVAGVPFAQLQELLKSKISKIYRNFNVSVSMGQLRSIRIYVAGQARQPGSFTVSSLSTLVNALFVTGGPSPQGSFRHIQVRRDGKVVTDFDLYDLLIFGDKSKDVPLLPGDVIYIPPVGPEAAVFGSVRNSAIYELKDNTTVAEIVKDAGGLSALASLSNAIIERIDEKHERTTISVSLTETGSAAGVQSPLHDGDILRITPITPRFSQTVTIRGNLADPGRFGWHAGMKLSDLIPDSAALVTRNYWERRNHAGVPSPDFEPDPTQRFQTTAAGTSNSTQQTGSSTQPTATPAGSASKTNGSQPAASQNTQGSGNTAQGSNTASSAQPVTQGGAQVDQYQQLASQLGGVGGDETPPINPNLPDCPAAWQSFNPNSGQTVPTPGVNCNVRLTVLGGTTLADQEARIYTENTAGADRINDVRLPAPDIDWSYAVIERLDPLTFRTSLIPFDLGKLVLAHDPTQDLLLEPSDMVTIFSQADIHVPQMQQTKLVRVEGEVAHAGVYSVQPGETLRQLVQRAGGVTENAYLYGAEFTRASTRVSQQARLDDYVSTLELEMDRATVASSANALSALDTASSQATQASTQQLITKLKLLRASGRIVLNLKPEAKDVEDLPLLMLQDGDRLVVPAVPPSVNVVGAVYDPSSFLFQSKDRVQAYLREAGGPNRDADRKHVFIVRADGAVLSKETAKSFWGNTFADETINPGDTIIVPEKVYKGSSLRTVSSIAGIFSGIGGSIATLAILAGVQ